MAGSDGETLEQDIKRGDAEALTVVITEPGTDDPHDITNERLVFEARLNKNDVEPIVTKTSDADGGITKTNAVEGEAQITIDKEDFLSTTKNVSLACQLSSIDAQGRPNTILFKVPLTYRQV